MFPSRSFTTSCVDQPAPGLHPVERLPHPVLGSLAGSIAARDLRLGERVTPEQETEGSQGEERDNSGKCLEPPTEESEQHRSVHGEHGEKQDERFRVLAPDEPVETRAHTSGIGAPLERLNRSASNPRL